MVLPDSWEFARNQGHGKLMMVLSDDDAMVPDTLERFVRANEEHDADFLFCTMAEYRDHAFPPEDANTLDVPTHTGTVRIIDRDVYLTRLMSFHPKYNTHPSGYVFETQLAKRIAERNNGRFFQTLGVEYFAWPVAAVLARNIVNIDVPLVVVGRTSKSWGTNMVLMNPGEGKINAFVSDAHTERRYTPLTNFTFNNLAIEGLLTAAAAFPQELRRTRWISAVTSGRRERSSNGARHRTSTCRQSSRSSTRTWPRTPSSRSNRTTTSRAASASWPTGSWRACVAIASSSTPSTPVTCTTSPTRSAPRSSSRRAATDASSRRARQISSSAASGSSSHTHHGRTPRSYMSSSACFSLIVSSGTQNPLCRYADSRPRSMIR